MPDLVSEDVWSILDEVKDPEIPVVSVVEMGMIRSVGIENGSITVVLSPTFIGCPAVDWMRREIENRLLQGGAAQVTVKLSFSPPWTSDRITSRGRENLKSFGLAPPPLRAESVEDLLDETAACPYCDSTATRRTNSFGPTLCRAIYVCLNCQQPFESFKPV
jgi:ring-1,2-phenylacetyl-CoA epoxidase subunit PaaD